MRFALMRVMLETTGSPATRRTSHLSLVSAEPWLAPDAIELACKTAVTDAFCALSDVDADAGLNEIATLAGPSTPPAAGSERWLGDPVVRRVAAFVYGTTRVDPARYGLLRRYVEITRESRYLVGLARTLATDGMPLDCTQELLHQLRIVWGAQDRKLAGDVRPLGVVAADVAREEEPEHTATAEGRRTVQRVRTSFGAVLSCVALDRPRGTRREEYTWSIPKDLELDEWRTAIDQATVRQMHIWNKQRRIDDLYFVLTEPAIRIRTIEWRGAVVEERELNALPNYEPMPDCGSASGAS